MTYKNFTDYLEMKHAHLYQHVLDDELQEHFENWLESGVDREELIKFADEFMEEYKMFQEEKQRVEINTH